MEEHLPVGEEGPVGHQRKGGVVALVGVGGWRSSRLMRKMRAGGGWMADEGSHVRRGSGCKY